MSVQNGKGERLYSPHIFEDRSPVVTPKWDGAEDYKAVFFPGCLPDESPLATQVRVVFEQAGYLVKRSAKAPTHPVWIVRAKLKTAPSFSDQRSLRRHIYGLLRKAGLCLQKNDVMVDQPGDRLLVSFLLPELVAEWVSEAFGHLPHGFDPIPE